MLTLPPSLHLSLSDDWQGSGQLWLHGCTVGLGTLHSVVNMANTNYKSVYGSYLFTLWGKQLHWAAFGDLHLGFVDT